MLCFAVYLRCLREPFRRFEVWKTQPDRSVTVTNIFAQVGDIVTNNFVQVVIIVSNTFAQVVNDVTNLEETVDNAGVWVLIMQSMILHFF